MTNAYLDRLNKPKSQPWRKQEKRVIKELGGRTTPGSGCLDSAKGDGDSPVFLYELKSTVGITYRLDLTILRKIFNEAIAVGKTPALVLSYIRESGASLDDYVILKKSDFETLAETAYGDDWRFE